MCGIAGMINLDRRPVSRVLMKKMTDSIAHRGPDGEGIYCKNFLAFGHRRLAIIDLSSLGNQPMITQDGRYVLTYNGEVYNFREIRAELKALGYKFTSQTDSEVVLNAYVEWGEKCVNKFNGMFAFGIWDNKNNELFIARDRYGIKPLYYAFVGNTFVFASEQKSIVLHPEFKKEIDIETIVEYFTFQNIFTDNTFLKEINIFPAGCYGKISLDYKKLNVIQYWDFEFKEDSSLNLIEEEYEEQIDILFNQAINRQLVSDVDIGAYLSGGVDSGSITAIAANQIDNLNTFTCGFDLNSASGLEIAFDERETAEYMSYLFKTEHYEMVLKSGDMERSMEKVAFHIEEPRVGQSYPNYYVSRLASKFVKVTLSGTGGDELFAGYPWRYYRAIDNYNFEDYIDKYYAFWQRLIPNQYIKKVFKPVWNEAKNVWTRDIFKGVFKNKNVIIEKPQDYINLSLYFEAKTFLHGLLVVEDKLSMANGLETRVPFLDNDFVDFALKVPIRFKLKNLSQNIERINENDFENKNEKYFKKTNDGKLILRNVMSKYVPEKVYSMKKQGFSAPDASWFKGESIEYVKSIIYNDKSRIFEILDKNTIRDLVNEHIDGKNNRRLLIWSLLNFESFLKEFI